MQQLFSNQTSEIVDLPVSTKVEYLPLRSPFFPFKIAGIYINRAEANAMGYDRECHQAILNY